MKNVVQAQRATLCHTLSIRELLVYYLGSRENIRVNTVGNSNTSVQLVDLF